jgi:hypothetical protein
MPAKLTSHDAGAPTTDEDARQAKQEAWGKLADAFEAAIAVPGLPREECGVLTRMLMNARRLAGLGAFRSVGEG